MYTSDIFSLSWIIASCVVVFAAFIRGVSGFGHALILAPILMLMLSSKSVVVIVLFIGFFLNLLLLRYAVKHVKFNRISPLILGSLLGIPLGTFIINIIDPVLLKMLIGGLTIAFAIPLALSLAIPFTREKLVSGIFGFLSGTSATSTGIIGPPIVLFIHNQKWEKTEVHSSLTIYFLFTSSFSLIALFLSGLINTDIVIYAVSFIPALLVGLGLGMIAFFRINLTFFRLLSMCVVIIAGILGILSGFGIISLA
jgi:uncharacterized membrane protein YfcA